MMSPIKVSGSNTTVTSIFDMPQAALIPKMNSFPNTINTQIPKISSNMILSSLFLWFPILMCSLFQAEWHNLDCFEFFQQLDLNKFFFPYSFIEAPLFRGLAAFS